MSVATIQNTPSPKSVLVDSFSPLKLAKSLKNSRIQLVQKLAASKNVAKLMLRTSSTTAETANYWSELHSTENDIAVLKKRQAFLHFLENVRSRNDYQLFAMAEPSSYRGDIYSCNDKTIHKLVKKDSGTIEFLDSECESIWRTVHNSYTVRKVESRYSITFGDGNTAQELNRLKRMLRCHHPDNCMYCADVSTWTHDEDDSWVSQWRFKPFEPTPSSSFDFFEKLVSIESAATHLSKWITPTASDSTNSPYMAFAGAFDKYEVEISMQNLAVTGVISAYIICHNVGPVF